ncbi:MAG: hypothetical protein AAFR11_04735 [Pseudomonadota bacterium]
MTDPNAGLTVRHGHKPVFEHILLIRSVILAIGLAALIRGVTAFVAIDKAALSLTQVIWTVTSFLLVVQSLWGTYKISRQVKGWAGSLFLLLIIQSATLSLSCSLLYPEPLLRQLSDPNVGGLPEMSATAFQRNRIVFLSGLAAYLSFTFISQLYMPVVRLLTGQNFLRVFGVLQVSAAIFLDDPNSQVFLATTVLATLIGFIVFDDKSMGEASEDSLPVEQKPTG